MELINIAYITDENYVMPTCVSIISLIENSGKETTYNIYVLTSAISEKSHKSLRSLENERVAVSIVEVEKGKYLWLAKKCLSEGIHVTENALYKFDLPNILNLDRVLYLDNDTIINKEIGGLYHTDISDVYVAAVDDMGDMVSNGQSYLLSRIGLKGKHYFNSGVMLLNLQKMREDNVTEKLLDYRAHKDNYFMDQDALNYVFYGKRIFLDYKYNFLSTAVEMYTMDEIYERFCGNTYVDFSNCLESQVIVHLTAKRKPWKYNIPWFTDWFMEYYIKSPYRDVRLNLSSVLYEYVELYKSVSRHAFELEKMVDSQNRIIEEYRNKKQWKFPYEKIKRNCKIILYGAGEVGRDFYSQIRNNEYCTIVLWVDKNWQKFGNTVGRTEDIAGCCYDYILVALSNSRVVEEVRDYLKKINVDSLKIITI